MDTNFEIVHTVEEFYDRPRFGLANFSGQAHLYECPFSETRDDYLDCYRLQRVDQSTFELALERWAIWKAWKAAFHAGEVPLATGPALPDDRSRHQELTRLLEPRLVFTPGSPFWARAEFRLKEPRRDGSGAREFEVRWTVVAGAEVSGVTAEDRAGSVSSLRRPRD